MEIGIVGLPKSGKTTIFNALTRGKAETAAYSTGAAAPNIGVAKVPEPRLQGLEAIFKPHKTTPAEVKYVDIAFVPKGLGKGEGISGPLLSQLGRADALLLVLRAFLDERVPHPEGKVDPERDLVTMNLELAFADLLLLERRVERLEESLKAAKAAEREAHQGEKALLSQLKAHLEKDRPLRELELSPEEHNAIAGYNLLTVKPLLIALNIGESDLPRAKVLEEEWRRRFGAPHVQIAALCGKLEMELAQLEEAEAKEFRVSLGLEESGLDRMLRLSYELLGLASFFTVVSGEVRAWTIPQNAPAVKAAGKIHSDMERGFIRAEVISYDDLMKCGSLAEAKKRGVLRLEGRTYPVKDGDVITFLFNV